MIYCLDTDTCIYALKGQFPSIQKNFQQRSSQHIKIPSIVRAELILGALKSTDPKKVLHAVDLFLEPFEVLDFGVKEALVYAKIRFDLERAGLAIGPNDLLIAATAIAHQGVLVTHNTKEFKRVSGLLIEDWTQ